MNKTITILIWIVDFIFYMFNSLASSILRMFSKSKPNSASYASESLISSVFNHGFVIFHRRRLSQKDSFENVLISGPTGSGKSAKLIVKNLMELKHCSMVTTDPGMVLWNNHSGYLSKHFNCVSFNPTNAKLSAGHNFLSHVKKDNDINKLVNNLSSPLNKGSSDPYWQLASQSLLNILIRLTLHMEPEYRNMATVLSVLNTFASNPKKIDALILETGNTKLIEQYKALVATPEKTLGSVISTAKAMLSIFEDPDVALTTSYQTIDIESLREKPTIIFIHSNVNESSYINVLIGLFYQQLFSFFLEKIPSKTDLPIYMIIEEASSQYIELLPLALANFRKYRIGTMLCLQQGNTQLKKLYGETDALNIEANCKTKIFLAGISDMQTLKMIETLGGKTTYKENSDDKNGKVINLINAENARMLKDNEVIVIHGNKPLIRGRVTPYYKSLRYRRYAKIPPLELQGQIPDEPLPQLF